MTLALPISLVIFVSVCCAIYQGLRPNNYPDLDQLNLNFAYSTIGFALSLLLVFKTNTAYARFWEARSAWGAVYTWCRTFMSRMVGYAHNVPPPMRQFTLRWTIALPYLLRSHLSYYKPGSDNIEALLTAEEVWYKIRWLGHIQAPRRVSTQRDKPCVLRSHPCMVVFRHIVMRTQYSRP